MKKMIEASTEPFVVDWQVRRTANVISPKPDAQALNILVVTDDLSEKERIGGWLAEAGHEVVQCPGPRAPEYTCVGTKGQDCPLARSADAVVLNLDLASDTVATGTPSWRLLDYYIERGHPVVGLTDADQKRYSFLNDNVVTVDRYIGREALLAAIEYLVAKRVSVTDIGTFRLTPRRRVSRPY